MVVQLQWHLQVRNLCAILLRMVRSSAMGVTALLRVLAVLIVSNTTICVAFLQKIVLLFVFYYFSSKTKPICCDDEFPSRRGVPHRNIAWTFA